MLVRLLLFSTRNMYFFAELRPHVHALITRTQLGKARAIVTQPRCTAYARLTYHPLQSASCVTAGNAARYLHLLPSLRAGRVAGGANSAGLPVHPGGHRRTARALRGAHTPAVDPDSLLEEDGAHRLRLSDDVSPRALSQAVLARAYVECNAR